MKTRNLVFIFLLTALFTDAQVRRTCSFRHYTTSDGLPSTQVQGLMEDSRGYIWTITDRGAAVFNGYDFKMYTMKDGMPTNSVLLINEDQKGRIWFMCNNGAYCFLDGDSIRPYGGNERISALLKDKLAGPFFFDDADTMWVTTFTGIQLFKCYGDSVSEFLPAVQNESMAPTYYLRRVGEKLVTLQIGDVTAENKLVTTDKISYLLSVAGDCKLACSVQVEENKWAVAGPGGYVVFNDEGDVQAHFNASPYIFSSLDHDRSGNLWLANSNGAYRLHDYSKDPNEADVFFEGHFITAIIQDRSGNYWFGDRDNGVYFVPSIDMQLYRASDEGKQNKIVSIKKCGNGIYYSDAAGGVFNLGEDVAQSVMHISAPAAVSLDFVQTKSGDFVVGSNPFLYSVKDNEGKLLNAECVVRRSLSLRNGNCVYALSDGLGFSNEKNVWSRIPKSVFKERCNALAEEVNGVLWVGTNNGLFQFKDSISTPVDVVNSLKARVVDIDFWNGYIVLATRNVGLIFYKGGKIIQFKEVDGLLSDITDCVVVTGDNELWIGQAGGLQRINILDIEQRKVSFFKVSDEKGLPSNEINDLFFDNGKLYAATNNGLIAFRPDAKSLNASVSLISITGLHAGNEHIEISASIHLQHNQNNIQFEFLALNFRTGDKTVYRFRLLGLHEEWQTTTNPGVDYWSLKPANYTFEVCSRNEDSEWSDPASVSFTVHPHFTQTIWFKVLAIVFTLAVIVFSFAIFYRNKKRKFENEAKMLELRQQALNANMNPHFIFNALNSIQHFINTNRSLEANEYLADFSKLIRMNLETNRHSMVSLEDELERLELYLKLEKLRFGDRMTHHIDIGENTSIFNLEIPPMLIQPYVENALLHGILPSNESGVIIIRVRKNVHSYNVEIEDNGIGIDKSLSGKISRHESLALRMNEERLKILRQQHRGDFSVKITDRSNMQSNLHGTLVYIELPID